MILMVFWGCVANNYAVDVVINEILAKATTGSDWFELYNAGNQEVNLHNWSVVDDYHQEIPWRLPEIIVLPNNYLLLWADQEDRLDNGLHTDFKLAKEGESLYLIDPSGAIIDQVDYPELESDQSYARIPDGGSDWLRWDRPSPEAGNQ